MRSGKDKAPVSSSFFNESFYREKLISNEGNANMGTYASYEYVKRYFEATKMNEIINISVKKTLESSELPENPYNMIGRLLLHEALFENIKTFYSIEEGMKNRPNSGNINVQISMNEPISHQSSIMIHVSFKALTLTLGWKIRSLIRDDRLQYLWFLLIGKQEPKQSGSSIKSLHQSSKGKIKMLDVSYCLGGSILLKTGSPFSAQEMISPTELIFCRRSESAQHYTSFANYVVESCLKLCESPQVVFIKIKIETYSQTVMEWSMDNLIHSKGKIVKELVKNCLKSQECVKAEYLIKVSQQGQKILGTSFLRVNRAFVLIEMEKNNCKIHSLTPSTLLLTYAFPPDSRYFQAVVEANGGRITPEELIHSLHDEMHAYMIFAIEEQRQSWVGWSIFINQLYEDKDRRSKDKQLWTAINFLVNSPLRFIQQILHEINVAKLISTRQSRSHNELQIYQIVQKVNKRIMLTLQKQEHVYPQSVIFLKAARKNIELILQAQQGKQFNIQPILQRVELMMKYLLGSFYQICFVLKGHLLNQIVKIDNQFGKEGSGEVITKTVTYNIFLRKYKKMPERNLNLQKQIKYYRQIFNRPDNDIRQIILAKYVKTYQLYQKIYEFYWDIICGKKLNYPMSKFINILRNQAIKFDCAKNQLNRELYLNLEEHHTDGIVVYQKAGDARGEYIFYSLSRDAMEDHKVRDYRTVFQVFLKYFQAQSVPVQNSLKKVPQNNKANYIISLNCNMGRGQLEESDFNKCKIYIDVIFYSSVKPHDAHHLIFQEIMSKLGVLSQNGFGVVGLYIGEPQYIDEDQVYAWIEQEQKFDIKFLRYSHKKPLQFEPFSKLIANCVKQNSQIIVRCVFWLNGLLKSCIISYNFYMNEQWLLNLTHTYQCRAFNRFDDVIRWSNYNHLKQSLNSKKSIQKDSKKLQLKQKYRKNNLDMIKFIVEDTEQNLSMIKVRNYSPFFSVLEQALSLTESIFYMLEYIKTDGEDKFNIKDFKETIELLEYYLFDQCLHTDRYIYSEGLSVTIINFITRINGYIQNHPDNNGQEKQLIYLQKLNVRLMNCVQYALTSCAFGVIQAMQSDYLQY